MSNNQNLASKLIEEWQNTMQQYLRDPRVAEIMVDYYAKSKKTFDEVSRGVNESNTANSANANDANVELSKLAERVNSLEARIQALEQLIIANFTKSN